MRVLLAIGDGLRAPGVADLRRSLLDSGLGVILIGPDTPTSSAVRQKPDEIESVGDDARNPIYRLDGSPVDCVHFAICSGAIDPAEVVIVGFSRDHAPEAGQGERAALAAASEAAAMGRPAILLAVEPFPGGEARRAPDDAAFSWCGLVASELAAWLVASPLPGRGILKMIVPFQLRGRALRFAAAGDSAVGGHLSVTPIDPASGVELSLPAMVEWVERAVASLNPRIGVSDGRCLAGCCG
jgi:5'-nucleotidase